MQSIATPLRATTGSYLSFVYESLVAIESLPCPSQLPFPDRNRIAPVFETASLCFQKLIWQRVWFSSRPEEISDRPPDRRKSSPPTAIRPDEPEQMRIAQKSGMPRSA